MKIRDSHHFHPILAMPPGPLVEWVLATRRVQVSGVVEHEHPIDPSLSHFHSGPLGPNGEPLGYSRPRLADLQPEPLNPSDDAAVRVWDDRLRH